MDLVPNSTVPCFPFSLGPGVSKEDLLAQLPSKDCCDYLIIQYFSRLSPLYHILHGPTFQRDYTRLVNNPTDTELSWLALLFIICSLTLNTMEEKDPLLAGLLSKEPEFQDFAAVARQLRNCAMICLSQDQFLIRHTMHTLETLLIMIYGIERTWVLLGTALNIGIAIGCNIKTKPRSMGYIEFERRRRCWAGILLLHTYQAIFFRDVRVSTLLDMEPSLPADVNDCDIRDDMILQPSSQPTQMSVIMFKLRLFELTSRICDHLASDAKLDENRLASFDSLIAEEQSKWDAKFLLDGQPSVLDAAAYAHWCFMQQYAHRLYLLLHRAFCRPRSGNPPRAESQAKCIASGVALLEIYRYFDELPRLRHYRWYVYGMTSFCALHGAVAVASCLLMESASVDPAPYRAIFDSTVVRYEKLRSRSQICAKSYPILQHLQAMLFSEKLQPANDLGADFSSVFDEWVDTVPWLNVDSVNWDAWNDVLNETGQ
ncbi:hypothetical protein FE257_000940 [Aspergillus nanangensis]|uniref:Xylanolytic transcriptional activator regulatory domain-containing protein n=1 Tax=Aspergillus nanangensis TaxID=2582783 RepID=A0AAD4CEP0_ASPNN|nr:hypothetical protein FE257_000940 [Aspergillus nanangensis]